MAHNTHTHTHTHIRHRYIHRRKQQNQHIILYVYNDLFHLTDHAITSIKHLGILPIITVIK